MCFLSGDLIHLGNNWLCSDNQINGITGLPFRSTWLPVSFCNEPSEPTTELFPTENTIWTSPLKLDKMILGKLIKLPFLGVHTYTHKTKRKKVEMIC